MPLSAQQKRTALTPCFVGALKPLQDYENRMTLDTLYTLYSGVGAVRLTRLASSFYPDKLYSLNRDLTTAELTQLANMGIATLRSFGQMVPSWVKALLRVIRGPVPIQFFDPAPDGVLLNPNGTLDQTSTQPLLMSSVVTERNGAGAVTRNLIFDGAGNCVAEVNFANHGGTAVSGHAHVYPILCVPITGHHAMGTPHVDMADYPAVWRQLPVGAAPATALGT